MSEAAQYEQLVQERKDALHASLTAWCRREGKSRAEFADALSLATGQRVTAKMIENWLERGALQRQMPAPMEIYWRQIARPLPAREHDTALKDIETAEFYESRRQA